MSTPRDTGPAPILAPGDWVVLALRRPFTILAVLGVTVAATFAWIGRQTPWWQADATLVLRPDPPRESALGALAGWSARARADAELAHLLSREVATRVVRPPADGLPPAFGVDTSLGLATVVDDLERAPHAAFVRRITGRAANDALVTATARVLDPHAPRELTARFLPGGRVRLAAVGAAGGEREAEEIAWSAGQPLRWRGLELRLRATADPEGKRVRVAVHDPAQAIRDLVGRTEAFETEPGSGVLRLSVRDTDPHRAAATANALARGYLERESEAVRRRASDLTARIAAELARLEGELDRSQARLGELFRDNPLSVSMAESSKFLTLNLADLEVESARLELRGRMLDEAIRELEAGRIEALARIAEPDTDKATRILIEHLAQLTAHAELQERADAGKLRHVLQLEILESREERGALVLELGAMQRAREVWDEDPRTALGLLGGSGPASTGIDPMTGILLEKVAHMQAEAEALLAAGYLEAHPDVVLLRGAIEAYLAQIERVLDRRIATLAARIDEHDRLASATDAMLRELPADEQRQIVAARGRLAKVVLDHLGSLRRAVGEGARSLEAEIADLRRELAALPVSERAQTAPLQLVAAAKERIAELLAAREEVRMNAVFAEPPARLVDPATPPSRRLSPRTGFGLGVAALFGLVLGFGAAWARERLGSGLRTPEDLRRAGAPAVAGVLPHVPDLARGGLASAFEAFRADDPRCPWIDDFQAVALYADGGSGGVIGVTSARSGEGKTAAAIGIASALARAGRRVLLLNAGLKRDAWLAAAGGSRHRALLDVAAGTAAWRETVAPSGQPRLDLCSVGVPGALAVDLLARGSRSGLLAEIAAEYDAVVVDLPALCVGPQVEDLAARLDRVLLVCRGECTPRADVTAACLRLDRAGVTLAGAVLTGVRRGPWRRASDRALRRLGLSRDPHLDLGERAA